MGAHGCAAVGDVGRLFLGKTTNGDRVRPDKGDGGNPNEGDGDDGSPNGDGDDSTPKRR